MYQIIKKLYHKDSNALMQEILHYYKKHRTAIINYIYGAVMVNRNLLWDGQEFINQDNSYNIKDILLESDFLLPDGAALRTMYMIGRVLWRRNGPKMLHNLNGTDFMPWFLDYLHASDYSVNIITLTVYDPRINNPQWYLKAWVLHYISKHRPKFQVHGEEILYGDVNYSEYDRSSIEKFLQENKSDNQINILLNFRGWSYGGPHQELFAYINRKKLQELELLCMNQWATVDFRIGRETRAPKRIRAMWLESAYRLFSDPKKNWKKFLVSFTMIWLIIKNIIFTRKN